MPRRRWKVERVVRMRIAVGDDREGMSGMNNGGSGETALVAMDRRATWGAWTVAAGMAAAADWFFYRHAVGWTAGAFGVCLLGAILLFPGAASPHRARLLLAAAIVVLCLRCAIEPGVLTLGLMGALLTAFSLARREGWCNDAWIWARRLGDAATRGVARGAAILGWPVAAATGEVPRAASPAPPVVPATVPVPDATPVEILATGRVAALRPGRITVREADGEGAQATRSYAIARRARLHGFASLSDLQLDQRVIYRVAEPGGQPTIVEMAAPGHSLSPGAAEPARPAAR